MYRAVVFVVMVIAVSADDEMRQCGRVFGPPSLRCCSGMVQPEFDKGPPSEMKECLDLPMKPQSCDRDECFAKKRGYYSADGGIDIDALVPVIEKQFEKDADLAAAIKNTCIQGDISKYGPPEMCDFAKLRHCIHLQILSKCTEWNDTGDCKGMKELVEECASKIL